MNKKIGILTFHYSENYGAFLQAYALQNYIKNKTGNNVEIIDYRPEFQIIPFKISPKLNVANSKGLKAKIFAVIDFIVDFPNRLKKRFRYRKARKKFNLSSQVYKNNEFILSDEYKAVILGSDQIWNPEITHGFDKAYFGFNRTNNCKAISYAASCGVSSYEGKYDVQMSDFVNNIDEIGVREKQSVDLLSKYTNKNIVVNVDPTLLVGRDFWRNTVKPINENNYILVYMLSNNQNLMNDAIRIAKQTGKKVLHFRSPSMKKNKRIKSLSFSGPFDFINYINSADLVLTDSFHATCFSLIFNKDFYTYLGSKRSERLISLAQSGKFENRLIDYGNSISGQIENKNDYYVNLENIIKESEDYLIKNIG